MSGAGVHGRAAWPAYALLLLAVLFWSGNVVTGRALREAIDPIALNLYRWAIAFVLLLPFALRPLLQHRRRLLEYWRVLVGLGITGIVGYQTCVYVGVRYTEAVNVLLIVQLAPVVIVLGARVFYGDRVGPVRAAGMALAALGAVVLIGRGDPEVVLGLAFGTAELTMLLAVVLWAAYSLLLQQRPPGVPQVAVLAASVGVGLVALLPAWLLTGGAPGRPPLNATALGGVAYVGVFASFFAFLSWNHGVARVGPGRASVFMYLMPVFGAVLGYLLLEEAIAAYHLAGAAFVFSGIAVMNRASGR